MAKDFNQLASSGKRRSLDWEGYLMKTILQLIVRQTIFSS